MKTLSLTQWSLVALCTLIALPASACRFNVRDVGFVDFGLEMYQLHLISNADSDDDFLQSCSRISFAALLDTNIELNEVNLETDSLPELQNQLSELGVSEFPAFVLESPRGNFRHMHLGDTSSDAIWEAMEALTSSTLREQILDHTIKNYGVALFIESNDIEKNKTALANTQAALQKITDGMHNLPKVINEPPVLMTLTPEQAAEDEILLWSLGIDSIPLEEPYLVVKYGRGRTIGDILIGDQITESRAEYILSVVGLSCECGLDRKWMLGEMFPLTWGADRQEQVIAHLGFDPESPMIKTEISQILSTNNSMAGSGTSRRDGSDGSLMGYTEMAVLENNSDVEPAIAMANEVIANEQQTDESNASTAESSMSTTNNETLETQSQTEEASISQQTVMINEPNQPAMYFSFTLFILGGFIGLVLLIGIAIAIKGRAT